MAGILGKSGPPSNQNAFPHGLVRVQNRRANGVLTPDEQTIRQEILAGLISDVLQSNPDQNRNVFFGADGTRIENC